MTNLVVESTYRIYDFTEKKPGFNGQICIEAALVSTDPKSVLPSIFPLTY
jgi:hypothetical protein